MIGTQADSKGPSLGTKKETSTAKTKTDAANRMHEKEMMNSCTRRSNETNMIGTITIRLYTQDRFNNAATAVDETHQHDIQLSQYSSHPTVRHPMLQPSMSNVNRIKNVLKEKAIVKEMNMMKQRKHQSKGKFILLVFVVFICVYILFLYCFSIDICVLCECCYYQKK
eukprot:282999_1